MYVGGPPETPWRAHMRLDMCVACSVLWEQKASHAAVERNPACSPPGLMGLWVGRAPRRTRSRCRAGRGQCSRARGSGTERVRGACYGSGGGVRWLLWVVNKRAGDSDADDPAGHPWKRAGESQCVRDTRCSVNGGEQESAWRDEGHAWVTVSVGRTRSQTGTCSQEGGLEAACACGGACVWVWGVSARGSLLRAGGVSRGGLVQAGLCCAWQREGTQGILLTAALR